jgi:DNA sulfur modification protein DndC
VTKDKSMEALVEGGEDWLEPMLDFRDLLASTQDPSVKSQVRDYKRRNGQVALKPDGDVIRGPYKFAVRKQFLRRLLEVQKQVRSRGPNPREILITDEELHEIRRLWRSELQDWEDSVPTIYREVFGEDLNWLSDEQPIFAGPEKAILEDICARQGIPSGLVSKLLEIQREMHGMTRRSSIHQRIAAAFAEDWRSEAEVLSVLKEDSELVS